MGLDLGQYEGVFPSNAEPFKEPMDPTAAALLVVAVLWAAAWGGIFAYLYYYV